MRAARLLFLYLMLVLLGGGLLAPWIQDLVQWVHGQTGWFGSLAQKPLYRYLTRVLLFLAFVGMFCLFRSLGIHGRKDLGLQGNIRWNAILRGFGLGFLSLVVVGGIFLVLGVRPLAHPTLGKLASHLLNTSLAAIVVACLEEFLFRGALLKILQRHYGWKCALLVSSLLFALVHFFEKPEPFAAEPAGPWAGLVLLSRMLRGFTQLESLFPHFFNFFLVGLILGVAVQRSGSLFFSIGLHAGWIFWMKSFSFITRKGETAPGWIWGDTKTLVDSLIATPVLFTVLLILFYWKPQTTACEKPATTGDRVLA